MCARDADWNNHAQRSISSLSEIFVGSHKPLQHPVHCDDLRSMDGSNRGIPD